MPALRDTFRYTLLMTWGMVTLVLLFSIIFLAYQTVRRGDNPFEVVSSSASSSRYDGDSGSKTDTRDILLYFADEEGRLLQPEVHRMPISHSSSENYRRVLNALIRGPKEGLSPILPNTVQMRGVYLLDGGELVLDFSRELEMNLVKSVSAETLMVQGILGTVSQTALRQESDPPITSVRFLFNGAPQGDSFPAHIDLSEPVTVDRSWFKSSQERLDNV